MHKSTSILSVGIVTSLLAWIGGSEPVYAQSARLDIVKARGTLVCGINPGLSGFSFPDNAGKWKGLDIDLCRAVSSAVFGDAEKVTYKPLSAKDRFTALQSGEVDLLARNASWTYSRNAQLGINFLATNFYDGQGFMVKKAANVKSAKDLNGATFCILQGTTTEKTMADYFRANGWKYQAVTFADGDALAAAYNAGRCDALTTDSSQLAGIRIQLPNPNDSIILPERISSELLSFAVRNGDDVWANIVRWSFYAMINGEELNLTSKNIRSSIANTTDPAVEHFAGKSSNYGAMLGLDRDWAIKIIEQVGNYAESYDRNIKPLGLERGQNNLWKNGGLMIAPPLR